jgi:aldose 1-epimerase
MDLLTLTAGDLRLTLAPSVGGAVAAWTRGEVPLFRPAQPGALAENSPRGLASYPLFPYSNRIAGRRFRFGGQEFVLPDLMNGWAIHGAGWQLPWTAERQGSTATLTLDFAAGELWPFAFHATQAFALSAEALVCDLALRNSDAREAPAAFGQHPYFPRGAGTTLRFRATHVWHNGADKIPTQRIAVPAEWDHAAPRPVGPAVLDNCFAGWDGTAVVTYPGHGHAIEITADACFRHLVVFVPAGEDFFAVEPVTNMNDGINRMEDGVDHGMRVLAPGETMRGRITYRVVPL